jgi:PD-(D/E)XK nuclease superfamily
MPWARASSLDRHIACPAASHLPMYDRGKWSPSYLNAGALFTAPNVEVADKDNSAAEWGTAMHDAKANNSAAQDPWLGWMDPYREKLWPSRLGEHEVTVAYNCRTRELERFHSEIEDERTAWKLARSVDCIVGSCDWWGQLPTGEPWIDDLKTGWQKPEVTTPQTLFYLMCRMKGEGAKTWDVGRASISWCPRKALKAGEEFQPPTRDGLWRQVTRLELEAFEDELHWAWVRVTGLNPQAKPGPHCKYCPSMAVCDKVDA